MGTILSSCVIGDKNDELSMLDLACIDLDIFALSKRNTRKRTFVTLTQHFVQTNL